MRAMHRGLVASAAYALLLLLLGTALAQTADDTQQCSGSAGGCSSDGEDSSADWQENATHATAACNMPVLDAGGLSPAALVQRLAAATTPLLIRGVVNLSGGWRAQAGTLGNRSALLEEFGGEQMQLSVATLLSNGPESTTLDTKKLGFMRKAWGAAGGSVLGDDVERQVQAGEPRPRVRLGDWLTAMREG